MPRKAFSSQSHLSGFHNKEIHITGWNGARNVVLAPNGCKQDVKENILMVKIRKHAATIKWDACMEAHLSRLKVIISHIPGHNLISMILCCGHVRELHRTAEVVKF